jgi:EAL domain-containing protein (putative c-di-GMP-specific phosphodiesterase class I)
MSHHLGLRVLGTILKPFHEAQVLALLQEFRAGPRAPRAGADLPVSVDELERALDRGAIELYYQPKVELGSERPVGVEALARLRHPVYGLVMPDVFIPVAEASGLITPLTMRVLELGIEQAGRWAADGLDLGVAFNLSVRAAHGADLPEQLTALAARAKVPNERITLEITERHVAGDTEMLHIVTRFRLRDFKLSIDDFGTGHSGLERLKRMPFTELKIDKAFVSGAAGDPDLRAILNASIQLGRQMRMNVVAEGVEGWNDWELLRGLGCDVAQGFVAARPLPPESIPQWTRRWAAAHAH